MISQLWKQSSTLTATAVIMLFNFALTLIGLALDPRLIGGAPASVKAGQVRNLDFDFRRVHRLAVSIPA